MMNNPAIWSAVSVLIGMLGVYLLLRRDQRAERDASRESGEWRGRVVERLDTVVRQLLEIKDWQREHDRIDRAAFADQRKQILELRGDLSKEKAG